MIIVIAIAVFLFLMFLSWKGGAFVGNAIETIIYYKDDIRNFLKKH